jgi:hypothetical protein
MPRTSRRAQTRGCSEYKPNDSDIWQIGGVAWTVDGGVTATLGRAHTGGLYEPKTCYESVPMTFSASGERADTGVTTVRGCGDAAPQLGACVTASLSGTLVNDAKATYPLDDGSSVLLTALPPTIQRTDARGTILYWLPLDYHDVELPYGL